MRAGVYLWVHLAALPVGAAVLPPSDLKTEVPVAPIAVLTGRPAEEVERQPRVRVAGQVTMVDPLVVQDASGGVFVNEWSQPRATASWPVVGDLVEVVGTLSAGGFTPRIVAEAITISGHEPLVAALPSDPGRLFSGAETGRRVAVEAVVQGCREQAKTWALVLEAGGRRFFADLPRPLFATRPDDLVDARVRLSGTVLTVRNTRGDFLGPVVRVASRDDLEIVEAPPTAAFESPLVSLEAVARFTSPALSGRRFRTRGVVTALSPGHYLCLQEDNSGIHVTTVANSPLALGDEVEAAGFLDTSGDVARMVEAVVRILGHPGPPAPLPVSPAEILTINAASVEAGTMAVPSSYEGCLVTFPARLVDATVMDQGGRLSLVAGETRIEATWFGSGFEALAALRPQSDLEVTGVVQLGFADSRFGVAARSQPAVNRLGILLRSPADVRLIEAPSWWTPQRLAVALMSVASVAAAALGWVWLLRRRVAVEAGRAAAEVAARREAALDYEITLRERTRLAANLHDTILQTVTGIGYQLKTCHRLAGNTPNVGDMARHLDVARKMLDEATLQLRGTVWSLRSLPLLQGSFEESLQQLVNRLREGHAATVDVTWQTVPAEPDEAIAGHLLLVVQEAVHNALHHGRPTQVTVTAAADPDSGAIDVRVADDGGGFELGRQRGPAEGHFGMAGMRERVERLGGRFAVRSTIGAGTLVEVQVVDPALSCDEAPALDLKA
jgi:signal transduction histidine kinase